ncbi:hypothetical protein [Brachybacterium sacelli]
MLHREVDVVWRELDHATPQRLQLGKLEAGREFLVEALAYGE